MRRALPVLVLFAMVLAACQDDIVFVDDTGTPAAPRALSASYYAGSVTVSWELAPGWNGEVFRVYSRRSTDVEWFFIAEVTSCAQDVCLYEDINVVPGRTYEYTVSAVNDAGIETDAPDIVEVFVPEPIAPPIPDATDVIALDGAAFVTWGTTSRSADDFSHYKVYLDDGGTSFLLGETDSEGFLDLLAQNGVTYGYFVTSVDADGHESAGSALGRGTPRPDFSDELVYAYSDVPSTSGFRFQEDESIDPRLDGDDPSRHFRLELDASGWWLVPGPGTAIHAQGFATTALKCGVAADEGCVDVRTAPSSNYTSGDVGLSTQTSYVLRVTGDDGLTHYGVIRVTLLGFDQNGDALMIFDWAYQLQPDNPSLSPTGPGEVTIGS